MLWWNCFRFQNDYLLSYFHTWKAQEKRDSCWAEPSGMESDKIATTRIFLLQESWFIWKEASLLLLASQLLQASLFSGAATFSGVTVFAVFFLMMRHSALTNVLAYFLGWNPDSCCWTARTWRSCLAGRVGASKIREYLGILLVWPARYNLAGRRGTVVQDLWIHQSWF